MILEMMNNEYFSFKKLLWDTENFSIDTYELTFKQEIPNTFLKELDFLQNINGLIYVKNLTCNRQNSKYIGIKTNAILYDTNITFETNNYDLNNSEMEDYNCKIVKEIKIDEDLNQFEYSRFLNDFELKKRAKKNVYIEWLNNSLNKENKYFLIIEKNKILLGYILFKVANDICTIELIAVKSEYQNMKLGTKLLSFLKTHAIENKISRIVVGTQISNLKAINFYIKNGFYVSDTTDIYHWWV
jgi:dTDP-4-amino-4,6-dideoxy-D-galactose acyltransferase